MLKKFGFDPRYWPELVFKANHFKNRRPVVGCNPTPYEADTGHKPSLGHICQIRQSALSQSRKSHMGWHHWQY